jgi:hypothetical protein
MNRRKGSQFSKSLSERNNFLNLSSNLKFSQCQNLGTTTGAYGLWYGRREKKEQGARTRPPIMQHFIQQSEKSNLKQI